MDQKEFYEKLRVVDGCERNHWYEIKTQNDIDFLIERYGGFHDSVIVGIDYKNNAWIGNGSIDTCADNTLSMYFRNQWVNPKLEMKFSNMEKMNLTGKNDYMNILFDCFLSFLDGKIIFADNSDFDPQKHQEKQSEGNTPTFITAERLSWRFIDD